MRAKVQAFMQAERMEPSWERTWRWSVIVEWGYWERIRWVLKREARERESSVVRL